MAELRVTVHPDADDGIPWWDSHGHELPHGIEVIIFYRDGTIGRGITQTNEPPLPGCICPWNGYDPDCPIPVMSEASMEDFIP